MNQDTSRRVVHLLWGVLGVLTLFGLILALHFTGHGEQVGELILYAGGLLAGYGVGRMMRGGT